MCLWQNIDKTTLQSTFYLCAVRALISTEITKYFYFFTHNLIGDILCIFLFMFGVCIQFNYDM